MKIKKTRANGSETRGKASLLDILGEHGRNGKPPRQWAEHHAELVRLRDELTGQRQSRTANAKVEIASMGMHMADAATDSYDRDWELTMASSDHSVLLEVNEALGRIANDTYGQCEITGKPIEASRLQALPWTRFCAAAQAELKARGAAIRTRLGHLGSYYDASEPEEAEAEEVAVEREAA